MKKTHQIYLFNTLTRQKEQFSSLEEGKVRLYTCGPTVYNFAHIGNLRTYIFEDLLKRVLQACGYKVHHVMNITDIDDKTIRDSQKTGETLELFTKRYTEAFLEDIKSLSIIPADNYPKATDHICEMVDMIQTLMERGAAYKGGDGSIYFSIKSFSGYGKLSHLNMEELKQGASERVLSDEYDKESVSDFVLWKAYDQERDGDVFWESPFGKGRPGWHIECSAMAARELGQTLDIHCGGVDNCFPHHENEIAQSESVHNKPFSRFWLHAEHLIVDGKKMSKSLGNFHTLRDLFSKGFSGREVRYLLLQTHYKTQLNFTFDGLVAARHSLERVDDFIRRLEDLPQGEGIGVSAFLQESEEQFFLALADDLNISQALAVLFELIRHTHVLCDKGEFFSKDGELLLDLLHKMDDVLGVLRFSFEEELPQEIQEAIKKREKSREDRNWVEADLWRAFIEEKGYSLQDRRGNPH